MNKDTITITLTTEEHQLICFALGYFTGATLDELPNEQRIQMCQAIVNKITQSLEQQDTSRHRNEPISNP